MAVGVTAEFEALRPRLLRLAYGQLGSLAEAEDVVQEAWLRLQRVEQDEIRDLEAWMITTVSRLALDTLRSARVKREAYVGPWLPEPIVSTDPTPEERTTRAEDVSLALMVVLWALSSFPAPPAGATGSPIEYSIAGQIGALLAHVLEPVGFNWQISIALVSGLAAREVAVGALGTVYSLSGGAERSEAVAFADAGRAMWFDGEDGTQVTVPDDEAIRLNGDFTIEMWHRADGEQPGDYPGLLKKGSAVMTGYIIYFKSFQTPLATMKRDGIDQIEAAGRPLDGRYRHLVFTYRAADTTTSWPWNRAPQV